MIPQYQITAQPASEPITAEQASAHLRVDSADDLLYITGLISVAREIYDGLTGRASAKMKFILTASRWDDLFDKSMADDGAKDRYSIPLFRSPLVSIESIKYYEPEATTLTTMSADDYRVVTTTTPGRVQIIDELPDTDERVDAIQIAFTAGTDTPSAMDCHAIKMITCNFYEQRTPIAFAQNHEIPYTLQTIIANRKIGGHFA